MIEPGTDHPTDAALELFTLGGSDADDAFVAHVSSCDACAERLAAEARLELALGELHAFRAGSRHIAKPSRIRVHLAPILVFAAAALVLVALRGRVPSPAVDVRAEPTAAASSKPADLEEVIASIRPKLRRCLTRSVESGGGEVILEVTIAGDGTVASVVVLSRSGLDDETASCLAAAVRSARFAATGHPTTFRLPVAMVVGK